MAWESLSGEPRLSLAFLYAHCDDEPLEHKRYSFNHPSHSSSKQDLSVGLRAPLGHTPGRAMALRLQPIISLLPDMTHAQPTTIPSPDGNKKKTEWAETKAGCLASAFHFSEKLNKYGCLCI